MGQELDAEVDWWISGWNGTTMVHDNVPTASRIIGRIETCQPLSSEATTKMNQLIADHFISNFGQETA